MQACSDQYHILFSLYILNEVNEDKPIMVMVQFKHNPDINHVCFLGYSLISQDLVFFAILCDDRESVARAIVAIILLKPQSCHAVASQELIKILFVEIFC